VRRDLISPGLAILYFAFFLACIAIAVYWLPRVAPVSSDGAFDAFGYAEAVVHGDWTILETQPFLNPYFFVREWIAPEFFAPLLHFALMLPALLLLVRYGREFVVPVIAALAFPEFLLFLGGTSKEGLAIAGMVWVILAFAIYRTGIRTGALTSFLVAGFIFELSRPFFWVLPLGALIVAFFLIASKKTKLLIIAMCIMAAPLAYLSGDFSSIASAVTEQIDAGIEFLTWFEANMSSDSAIKDYVRKALSLGLVESDWKIAFFATFLILAKAALYTFAIPLISPQPYEYSMAFAWAFLWQIAVSLTSLFVLYFCVKHLPRKLREGTKEERLMILFALFFAMAIAASTLIFHVRYRAPAEFLLVVLALQTIRFSAAPVFTVGVANAASIGLACILFLPPILF